MKMGSGMEGGMPLAASPSEGEARVPVRSPESREDGAALNEALAKLLKKAAATDGELENPAVVAEAARLAQWEAEQHRRFDAPGDRR